MESNELYLGENVKVLFFLEIFCYEKQTVSLYHICLGPKLNIQT